MSNFREHHAYKKKHSRRRDKKKVKKDERQNPCTGDNGPSKRIRMTEVQSLNTSGYAVQGGRARFLGDETRMEVLGS